MNRETESRDFDEELRILFGSRKNIKISNEESGDLPSQIILDRNRSLRQMNKFSLGLVVIFAMVVAVLTQALVSVSGRPPLDFAFLKDADNNVVRLQSTSIPSVTEEDVLIFAVEKLKAFHKLAFTDYIEYVTSLEKDFTTESAFNNYQQALLDSKTIEKMRDGRQLTWAEPLSAPRIVDFDEDNMQWTVVVDFRWFMGGGEFTTDGSNFTAVIYVDRVSRKKNQAGLSIGKYLIETGENR